MQKASGFIRKKRVKGQVYWYLVRAVWREGKPRQEVIGYVGKAKPQSVAAALRTISDRQEQRAAIKMPVAAFYEKYGTSPTAQLHWLEAARVRRKKREQNRSSQKSR